MGAEGTRCSMGIKGAQRKILSTLHPNTILKPNPDLMPAPTLRLVLILPVPLALALIKTEYWDRAGWEGTLLCHFALP